MAAFPTPLRRSSINALALATPVAGANCFSGVQGQAAVAVRLLRPGTASRCIRAADSPHDGYDGARHPTLNAEQRRLRAANGRWKMPSRTKSRLVTVEEAKMRSTLIILAVFVLGSPA